MMFFEVCMLKKTIFFFIVSFSLSLSGELKAQKNPAVLNSILNQCGCQFEREKAYSDSLAGKDFLLATLRCDCGQVDVSLAVACALKDGVKPTPKECALDEAVQVSQNENKWPQEWPDMKIFQDNSRAR